MRRTQLVIGALGVCAMAWGVWLLSDDDADRLASVALWLAGVVLLHDAVLAPLVIVLGVVAAKVLPQQHRRVAAVAFLVWGTLTLAVANVLSGVGGKPDMDSLLNRPYVTAWLALSGLVLVAAVASAAMMKGHRTTDA